MSATLSPHRAAIASEALSNATSNNSLANYAAIYAGFAEKGIPEADIQPRHNVFTFNAWLALGRSVRKGEHGVKVCTWVPMTKKDGESGEAVSIGRKPRMTTVFHVSQTRLIAGTPEEQRADMEIAARFIAEQSTKRDPVRREAPADYHAGYYSDQFTPL